MEPAIISNEQLNVNDTLNSTPMNYPTTSNDFDSDLLSKQLKLDANDILKAEPTKLVVKSIQITMEKVKSTNDEEEEETDLIIKNGDTKFDESADISTSITNNSKHIELQSINCSNRTKLPCNLSNDLFDSNIDSKETGLNSVMQSDQESSSDAPDCNQFNEKHVENVCLMKSLDDLQSIEQINKSADFTLNNKNNSSNSDENEHFDVPTHSIATKLTSMLTVSIDNPTTIPLKRAPAISDLHNMNEYSDIIIDITNDSKSDTTCIENQSSKSIDFIEECKVLMEGINVRAAEMSKLIQILIESFDDAGQVINNSNYPRVFFLMHKWFTDSDNVAKMLFDLYQKYEDQSPEHQLKTCHAFRFWIKNFPAHFGIDESLKGMISQFWSLVRSKGHKDHLRFIDVSNIESYDWIRKQTKRNPVKSKSKTEKKSELAFDKLGADVIAYQFTYLEWKTLRRITFNEYKSYAVKGSIQDNPPLERSIQLFNGMSQWIQTMVLKKTTPKQRAERIHKFIQVAQHLRQLHNFNSLMAVVGGICHSSIARLSKTNSHLSIEDQKALNDLMDLLSSNFNYAQYRKTIGELKGFFIPIIGIHLKDMISLHTAHMDKLDNNLVNFRKMVQLSVIFQSLNDLQNSESPVQANTSGYLEVLQVALEMFYCEDEIYERSLNMEPRTSISSPSSPEKRQEFADWAKSISTPLDPRTIKKHVNDMVNTVFKNYDHDNDGFISNEEFNEIAQNFPFIDSFAVLDADKDGLISPEEMQTYFLKANHQALKNEFKHDFHEWTYYKPTYCILCDGLLWGLIKQGWKCVDCRINAHKHCKETLVMECRSKRTMNLSRHMSNSGAEQLTRNRSTSNHSSARKNIYPNQKMNHTTDDDIFMSGDSTEEDNNDDISFIRSTTSNSVRTNDATDQTHLLYQSNRHKRYNKKSPKRRKSLPPQSNSNNSDSTNVSTRPTCLPNALIPRGPLICSNIENLENYRIPSERSFCPNANINNSKKYIIPNKNNSNNNNNTESSNSSLEYTGTASFLSKNYDLKNKNMSRINVMSIADLINDKKSLAMPEETADIDFNITFNNINNFKSQLYSDINQNASNEINKRNLLEISSNRHIANNRLHSLNQKDKTLKNTSCNINSKSLEDSCFVNNQTNDNLDSYDYFPKTSTAKSSKPSLVSSTHKTNPLKKKEPVTIKAHRNYTDEVVSVFRHRNDSDYDLDDFIEESILSDAFSSNDEDNDVYIKLKLKEEERKRIDLERENEKIKKELESANAQITSLRNVMSTIVSSDKINLIQDKMDLLKFTTKDSEA